jgi:hypothetical protein
VLAIRAAASAASSASTTVSIIPDEKKTLRQGAVWPGKTEAYRERQQDMREARAQAWHSCSTCPWRDLHRARSDHG